MTPNCLIRSLIKSKNKIYKKTGAILKGWITKDEYYKTHSGKIKLATVWKTTKECIDVKNSSNKSTNSQFIADHLNFFYKCFCQIKLKDC